MKTFAFLVHPRNIRDLTRTLPFLRVLPAPAVLGLTRYAPQAMDIREFVDASGELVRGRR